MACIQNCSVSDTVVTLAVSAGTFVISQFAAEGEAVSFDATETNIDRKYTSSGDLMKSGSNFVRIPFSLTVPCDAESQSLWDAYKLDPMGFCGTGEVDTNCCSTESFKTLDLISVDRPNISDTVEYFTFSFEGVPQGSGGV